MNNVHKELGPIAFYLVGFVSILYSTFYLKGGWVDLHPCGCSSSPSSSVRGNWEEWLRSRDYLATGRPCWMVWIQSRCYISVSEGGNAAIWLRIVLLANAEIGPIAYSSPYVKSGLSFFTHSLNPQWLAKWARPCGRFRIQRRERHDRDRYVRDAYISSEVTNCICFCSSSFLALLALL